ncbi:MAG TPA: mucoidy inhibitor MuiA family protein [Afifellaceae bacterium]|nr:mucoidy inhibitor MuiA family protein [Afifellaceae bacterium]
MKHTLFAMLAASTFLSPVQATEFRAPSKIDAVTVYPQGAEVTRVATVQIAAGDHTLLLDDLPGEVDPQSIRVEGETGEAVEIGSVDSRQVHVTGDAETASQRREIADRIEILRDEFTGLDQMTRNIDYQRTLIQDLARKPFITQNSSDNDLRVDSAELGNLFDLVASRLQALDKRALDAGIRKRQINKQIGDLENQLSELAPQRRVKSVVTVNLSSEAATSGTFRIKYRIHNAGWRPFYDARLSMPETGAEPALSLVRRAEIVQNTTESWDNVDLTLSTARPVGATAAPDLSAYALGFGRYPTDPAPIVGLQNMFSSDTGVAAEARAELDMLKDARLKKATQQQAQVEIAGFQALYAIPGRVTVDNQGTAKKVQISADDIDARLSAHAVPLLDPNAYLTASFTVDGETPLLPGRVLLFRDNVYMGQGALPLLTPGEDHALGFGVDDRIKVKRTEVHRETSESGIISMDLVEERSWVIEVQNLHVRTMPVRILDRMPYATHEDINVNLLAGTTKPSERNVERKQGVLAWDYEMAEGDEQTIKFGYRVSSPKDKPLQLGMLR